MKYAFLVIILLLIGGVFYFKSQQSSQAPLSTPAVTKSEEPAKVETNSDANKSAVNSANEKVKEFEVEGSSFKFLPKEIKVKKGDTVKVIFKNTNGFHDFTVDTFNAKTKQIPADQTDTIEFVADKAGTFEYYCSVGQHRQMGMAGTLIVEE